LDPELIGSQNSDRQKGLGIKKKKVKIFDIWKCWLFSLAFGGLEASSIA
jgi:hypothetical protein